MEEKSDKKKKYGNLYEFGAPPMYQSPEELQKKIQEYFNEGIPTKRIVIGRGKDKKVIEIPMPTITGLTLYLGFQSRQSFYDLEKRAAFSYTVKRARVFIEREYEQNLLAGNTVGAIFALKNMGWIDKTVSEVTNKPVDLSGLSEKEKFTLLEIQRKLNK